MSINNVIYSPYFLVGLAPPEVPPCRRGCRLKGSSNCSAYGKSVPPCCTQGPRGIAPWHRGKGMATRRLRGLWMITTKYVLDYYGMSCMDDCGLFMDYMDCYGFITRWSPLSFAQKPWDWRLVLHPDPSALLPPRPRSPKGASTSGRDGRYPPACEIWIMVMVVIVK